MMNDSFHGGGGGGKKNEKYVDVQVDRAGLFSSFHFPRASLFAHFDQSKSGKNFRVLSCRFKIDEKLRETYEYVIRRSGRCIATSWRMK